jgi:HKD family nuclease
MLFLKKLAVPLINERILAQAEHCYIATAAISEDGFEFIRSRTSPKCKIEIVTGLDEISSPQVLRKIWRNLHDRVTLKIYTKNTFHLNVYIFDLPFRKTVAFVGSGTLSLEGLKDDEEIFYKVLDVKDIEGLKSLFTGYFEFATPLHEELLNEYELIFPEMHQRIIQNIEDRRDFISLTASGFNWDSIKFKNQYFKKEDYLTFATAKASIHTEDVQREREGVLAKLLALNDSIKDHLTALKLEVVLPATHEDVKGSANGRIKSVNLVYTNTKGGGKRRTEDPEPFHLKMGIGQRFFRVLLGAERGEAQLRREHFQVTLDEPASRTALFKAITFLEKGYYLEVRGERKAVEAFSTEDALIQFLKKDDWRHYRFVIAKDYTPGDVSLNNDKIGPMIVEQFRKLVTLR